MLTITPEASQAIRGILASESVPEGAVLRISAPVQTQNGSGPAGTLAMEVVDSPQESDQRVRGDEVEVAVDPAVADVLEDMELDAKAVGDDQVNFTIGERDSA